MGKCCYRNTRNTFSFTLEHEYYIYQIFNQIHFINMKLRKESEEKEIVFVH